MFIVFVIEDTMPKSMWPNAFWQVGISKYTGTYMCYLIYDMYVYADVHSRRNIHKALLPIIALCVWFSWHLKSPWSLCGKSLHLTLVTKWSQSWSLMTYSHHLCSMSIGPPFCYTANFKIWPWNSLVNQMCVVKGLGHIWPWKLNDQGHCQGQTWWSHLRPKVQSICLLVVSWQSDHFGNQTIRKCIIYCPVMIYAWCLLFLWLRTPCPNNCGQMRFGRYE